MPADGTIQLHIVPMCGPDCHEHGHDHHHHDTAHGEAVELLAVNVQAY
jgi:tyrosinase